MNWVHWSNRTNIDWKMLNYLEVVLSLRTGFGYVKNVGIFQDYDASFHRDKIIHDWFENKFGLLQRMMWPPRSPDMILSDMYET